MNAEDKLFFAFSNRQSIYTCIINKGWQYYKLLKICC